jgi:hypothetical protein
MHPPLPSNRLILNGNKLHTVEQLITHRLKLTQPILDQQEISQHLDHYPDLSIAIWHSSHFLEKETKSQKETIINIFKKYGDIKMT